MVLNEIEEYITISMNKFTFLNVFFEDTFKNKWNKYLSRYLNLEELFKADHLNLLLAAVGAGYETKHKLPSKPITPLLQSAEIYLSEFSSLLTEKDFLDKLSNPGERGFAFISTLSELSIAYRLKQAKYEIEFEFPFRKDVPLEAETNRSQLDEKDVDIKVVAPSGKVFFIEVYNPKESLDSGFYTFSDHETILNKVAGKLRKKFGPNDIIDLESGSTFLAVNTAHIDSLTLGKWLDPAGFQGLLANSTTLLPQSISGIIYFEDDFAGHFSFNGIWLKDN